ncbi:hypothetical protein pdam_00018545, partial [Pocillopora damicornis]
GPLLMCIQKNGCRRPFVCLIWRRLARRQGKWLDLYTSPPSAVPRGGPASYHCLHRDVTLVVIKKKLLFHDLYTAVRSDYLRQIDFVIELVDYNLFMSSGQEEAGLVKMTVRQVDASQNLSTAPHHKTVPSDVCTSRSYSRARNRLSYKKYSCNLQLQLCYLRNTLHLASFGLFQNGGRITREQEGESSNLLEKFVTFHTDKHAPNNKRH